MLFKEMIDVNSENEMKYSLWEKRSYWLLKQAVCITITEP